MKRRNLNTALLLFLSAFMFSSCEAIEGIFKAGMGFGIFLVILIIGIIIFIISKLGKNK